MSQNIEKKQIDLIEESICVYKTCNHCIELHKKGELSFDAIEDFVDDRGKSCLYRLKQMCHDLFRNTDQAASYKEKFYDITVGYIFHEAMKLRECIYQLEYYRPEYNHLLNSHELTPAEKKLIHEFDTLIGKADKRVAEGLKEIKILLKELVAHVRELLKIYRDNYLLPRFILDNERSFIMIYGKSGYQDLLEDLYDRRTTLMFKAAVSYLQSEYYQIARGLFHKVVHTDRNNAPAKFLFLYTSAYNCYLRNRISMAKIFAEEALTVPLVRSDGMDRYKESLRKLVPELTREIKKMKERGKEDDNRAYL